MKISFCIFPPPPPPAPKFLFPPIPSFFIPIPKQNLPHSSMLIALAVVARGVDSYYFAARNHPVEVYHPRHVIRERVSVSRVGFVRSTSSAKPSFRCTIQSPSAPSIEMAARGEFKRAGWPCKSRGTRLPFRIPDVALCRRIIHTRSRITQPVTTCITLMSNNGPELRDDH